MDKQQTACVEKEPYDDLGSDTKLHDTEKALSLQNELLRARTKLRLVSHLKIRREVNPERKRAGYISDIRDYFRAVFK